MTQIRHLLVPTDGSEGSTKAATFAGDLARALGAKITVLYVQDERSIVSEAWNAALGSPASDETKASLGAARATMEAHAKHVELADTRSAVGELSPEPVLEQSWGHPADEICRYADDHEVDLIVMGSHGRSALKRAILGSVSHAVVNSAPCAVTIVR